MIANRPDWCVSRQRNWGVPMPFFVHRETMQLHSRTLELLEEVAQRVEQQGIEAWFSLDAKELLGDDAAHYRKLSDTLDVWFDSGTTHASVLRRREDLSFPADLYLEGSDQHRGWFQSSLLTSCAINGRAPYDALLTHGFVVDGHGHKMSKSKGNVIAPQKIFDTLGADILRLWAASTDYSGELTISDEILKRVVESYRRIRNTLRFLLANIADFDIKRHELPLNQWLEIDVYALLLTQDIQHFVCGAQGVNKQIYYGGNYNDYDFHVAIRNLHDFCSDTLGSFYLDILKDRLYTCPADSTARRSAQNALYHIAHSLIRMLAPILSFTAEEAWQHLTGNDNDSVMLHGWYTYIQRIHFELEKNGIQNSELQHRWQTVAQLRNDSKKQLEVLRQSGAIGSSLAADITIFTNSENYFSELSTFQDDLRFVFVTSSVTLSRGWHPLAVRSTLSPDIQLLVTPSTQPKCERCWHYRADVGSDAQHATLCARCVSNLFGSGEVRRYA